MYDRHIVSIKCCTHFIQEDSKFIKNTIFSRRCNALIKRPACHMPGHVIKLSSLFLSLLKYLPYPDIISWTLLKLNARFFMQQHSKYSSIQHTTLVNSIHPCLTKLAHLLSVEYIRQSQSWRPPLPISPSTLLPPPS